MTPDMKRLSALRSQIRDLQRQIDALAAAPLASAEVTERVHTWLQDFRDRYSLHAFEALLHPASADDPDVDPARLLVHLFGDELEERLIERLHAACEKPGLPAAKRQTAIAELIERRHRLERDEELAILQAEDAGADVARRRDVDAALVADLWAELLDDEGKVRVDAA